MSVVGDFGRWRPRLSAIVGGHTVRDPEVKYGLAVTGVIDPTHVLSNRGARAGDALVLSKALGTGVVGQAIKKSAADEADIAAAILSMTPATPARWPSLGNFLSARQPTSRVLACSGTCAMCYWARGWGPPCNWPN